MHWKTQIMKTKESTDEEVQIQRNYDHFFNIQRIVQGDWVPRGQTVKVYKEVLTDLHKGVRRKNLRCEGLINSLQRQWADIQ